MPVAKKSKPKYKVGDYIGGQGYVLNRVAAVITDGGQELYGLTSIKRKNGQMFWMTAYEIDEAESQFFERPVVTPDWKAYKALKQGDVLASGGTVDDAEFEYHTVLAVVGDAYLLSQSPLKKEAVDTLTTIAEQIKSMTDGEVEVMDDDTKRDLKKRSSYNSTSKRAGEWYTSEQLCLMNWKIISE